MRTLGATLRAALFAAVFAAVAGLLAVLGMRQEAVSAQRAMIDPPLGAPEACARNAGLPTGFGREPLAGMVRVPGGEFEPGSNQGYPDERPAGQVRVEAFWIDRTEVTNAQFSAFVQATRHVTGAEREGAAVVFKAPPRGRVVQANGWWAYVKGADWRHPEGPGSDLRSRDNQPVVHVTLADAQAYARWLGRELPTEAQWEWAARGGGNSERLEREPRADDGRPQANYWQGMFPDLNTREDGFVARAPVGCFPANGYGLHDMIGNVWEWTSDAYRGPRQAHGNGEPAAALTGSVAPGTPMVIKGGSFLCAADYCMRYRAAARHPQEADLGVAHVGFRTVARQR